MTTETQIVAALEGLRVISYATLLEKMHERGTPPRGMVYPLQQLEQRGVIRMLDRQGKPWVHLDPEANRGPLYIQVVPRG